MRVNRQIVLDEGDHYARTVDGKHHFVVDTKNWGATEITAEEAAKLDPGGLGDLFQKAVQATVLQDIRCIAAVPEPVPSEPVYPKGGVNIKLTHRKTGTCGFQRVRVLCALNNATSIRLASWVPTMMIRANLLAANDRKELGARLKNAVRDGLVKRRGVGQATEWLLTDRGYEVCNVHGAKAHGF